MLAKRKKANNSCDLKTNVNLEIHDPRIQKSDNRLMETESK